VRGRHVSDHDLGSDLEMERRAFLAAAAATPAGLMSARAASYDRLPDGVAEPGESGADVDLATGKVTFV